MRTGTSLCRTQLCWGSGPKLEELPCSRGEGKVNILILQSHSVQSSTHPPHLVTMFLPFSSDLVPHIKHRCCCVNFFSRFIGDLKMCEDTLKHIEACCAWEVYLMALTRTSADFLFFLFIQFQTGASQQRGGQTKRPRTNPGDNARPTQKGGQQEPRVQPQPAHNGRPQEEQRHDPLLTNLMVGARRLLRCESVKGNTTWGLVCAPG